MTSRTLTLWGCLVDAQHAYSISCCRIGHLTKLEMIIIIMLRSSILLWELRGASKEGEEGTGTGGGVGAGNMRVWTQRRVGLTASDQSLFEEFSVQYLQC